MRTLTKARRLTAIGIDLGTANTLAVSPGAGIVFDQPSVCCFQAFDAVPRFIAAGTEASSYVGKIARPLKIVRPLQNGVLSEMVAARELLHFVRKVVGAGWRFRRIRPHIGIPADATQSERGALRTAAIDAGFGEPKLIPEPLLAAIGLGLAVHEARGRMIVDCGAGTTEVAVISLGTICVSKSVRGGGEALDRALIDYLNFHHRFQVGTAGAEALKLQLSTLLARGGSDQPVEIKGLDMTSGLPRVLFLPASELLPVWLRHVEQIVEVVREALRDTPPEMSHDVLENGIVLSGGGALNALLADRISSGTGVPTRIADTPKHCVAAGLQRLLEHPWCLQPMAA